MITIIDYGMGNLRSVQKACEYLGYEAKITSSAAEIARAEKLILPGVGAFRDAIGHLKEQNLVDPIREYITSDKPFLGVCLGLQLLFEKSYEDGEYEGLGVIPGEVVRFPALPGLKVPHMGWNRLEVR
ncbi:MAG TPA: imidazole glycerol phosphate synthase subunit HisH, partial [Planctomycetaceae bacterium]|nr:imidazole glycerol phosphate synthase subunit HisH [Planctomycetaceae bacterium]